MTVRLDRRMFGLVVLLCLAACTADSAPQDAAEKIDVLLIPADGGTESGTLADYQPLFNAVGNATGLSFELKVAQSYGAVVQSMCDGSADVAFVGPVTYIQAEERGCAELLAVARENGQSIYYAGLFSRKESALRNIGDLRGKSVAFGDVNSASSFTYQVAMLLEAGIDPVKDMGALRLTGTHANSLAALVEQRVDAAALSFDSYEKAVRSGVPGAQDLQVIARSEAIPYPPLVMNTALPPELKAQLRTAFGDVAKLPGIRPEMIRGYGGRQVDGYDTGFPHDRFASAAGKMALLNDEIRGEILKKAAER